MVSYLEPFGSMIHHFSNFSRLPLLVNRLQRELFSLILWNCPILLTLSVISKVLWFKEKNQDKEETVQLESSLHVVTPHLFYMPFKKEPHGFPNPMIIFVLYPKGRPASEVLWPIQIQEYLPWVFCLYFRYVFQKSTPCCYAPCVLWQLIS